METVRAQTASSSPDEQLAGFAGLQTAERNRSRQDVVDRAFDLVVASLLLLLALPVILLTALGSAIALRAWPFFVQDRVGRNGELFRFVKVRTLPPTTNAYADKYALSEVSIPRFMSLLRAVHLDELPQLALVVIGKMSLVGPRPEMPGLSAELPRHVARSRTLVRPGLTGLWQVSERCDGLIVEAPEFDAHYVQHHTVRLDLWIIVQTVVKILHGGKGSVTLADVPAWTGPAAAAVGRHDVLDLTLFGAAGAAVLQDIDA
jgi:lipopolysaccharide/colanic/teichoic acid biosynthesis glycosyltransferase